MFLAVDILFFRALFRFWEKFLPYGHRVYFWMPDNTKVSMERLLLSTASAQGGLSPLQIMHIAYRYMHKNQVYSVVLPSNSSSISSALVFSTIPYLWAAGE